MSDHFKINGPTCLSCSGGRTSGLMLRKTLDANTPEVLREFLCVAFANTGREDEATLRFLDRMDREWLQPLGIPLRWLEYGVSSEGEVTYTAVNFATASRNGEPFSALIRHRKFLPNPVTRFCTSELKIRTMHRFIRAELKWSEWDQFIGIRADEQRRASKIRARGTSTETKDESMCIPLADAGITVQDVGAFWSAQSFNLELLTVNGRTLEGNCDLCFLKPVGQRVALIAARPERAIWWIGEEAYAKSISDKPAGAKFNRYSEPDYAQMTAFAADQRDMFNPDEEAIACFCGD